MRRWIVPCPRLKLIIMSLPKHHLELLSPARDAAIAKEAILHGAEARPTDIHGIGAMQDGFNSVADISRIVVEKGA